jgi:serine/threonine protein kinase
MLAQSGYNILDVQLVQEGKVDLAVVLYQKNHTLYLAGTCDLPVNFWNADPARFNALRPRKLDLANIHPQYTNKMTKATSIHVPENFVKRPCYLQLLSFVTLEDFLETNRVASVIQREISTCEILRRNPHRNVAKYIGLETSHEISFPSVGVVQYFEKEVVIGIVFERYDTDLDTMVRDHQHVDIANLISDVTAGLNHLHRLGIVHADIKPANIFHKNGRFVIGDFDSAHHVGDRYRLKAGTPGWDRDEWEFAKYGHDWYGLNRLEEWVKKANAPLPLSYD